MDPEGQPAATPVQATPPQVTLTMENMATYFNQLLQQNLALQQEHAELKAEMKSLSTAGATTRTPSAASSSSSSPLKWAKPAPFEGTSHPSERGLQAQMWLADVNRYLTNTDPTASDSKRIEFAAGFLREAAQQWWYVLDKSGNTPTTWKDFTDQFLARFVGINDEVYIVNRFLSLSQKGRLTEYVATFDLYLLQLGITPDQKVPVSQEAINRLVSCMFVNGLKAELRDRVIDAGYKQQYQDARQLAFDHDANQSLARVTGRSGTASSSSSSSNSGRTTYASKTAAPPSADKGPTPMELGSMQSKHPNGKAGGDRPPLPRANITEAEEKRRRSMGLCMYCGAEGHRANACHARQEAAQKA